MGCHMSTINKDALNQLTGLCSENVTLVLITRPSFMHGKVYITEMYIHNIKCDGDDYNTPFNICP